MADAQQLANELRVARQRVLDAAAGLSDDEARARPADDEWSVIEVLAHLVDLDRHWLEQALLLRDVPDHVFVNFDDERWKREHPDVRQLAIGDVRARLEESHEAVLLALREMTPEMLETRGLHPRGHPYRVKDVFRRYPDHDHNHAGRIRSIRGRLSR